MFTFVFTVSLFTSTRRGVSQVKDSALLFHDACWHNIILDSETVLAWWTDLALVEGPGGKRARGDSSGSDEPSSGLA